MSDRLAERYESLLEAYPESYRAERGPEILGTLLDGARPGQRWPSPREALALLTGGLRTRLARRSPSYRAWWYGVLHLGAMLFLIPKVYALSGATLGNYHVYADSNDLVAASSTSSAVWFAFGCLTLVAVLGRWYRVALGAAAALALLELLVLGRVEHVGSGVPMAAVGHGVLLVLLAALVVMRPTRSLRPPRAWLAVVIMAALYLALAMPSGWMGPLYLGDAYLVAGILASLLLGLFDVRVPAAAALYLIGSGVIVAVTADGVLPVGDLVRYAIWSVAGAGLLTGASLMTQRVVIRL